jgi:hypothetical protein
MISVPRYADIARRLGMKGHTVGKRRRDERWDDLLLKIDRRAAAQMVEKLASERTTLNVRHYRYWDLLLTFVGTLLQETERLDIREMERVATIIDRAQKGQRLARGLRLSGETEEQIRAQSRAEARELIDAFIDAVTENVSDEGTRNRIRQTILERIPTPEEEEA